MSSFESINYMLRPNKNVERKLILESLQGLNSPFDFSKYVYIGLGSMWFVDFILAHKHLLISEMISIQDQDAQRARFNIPFSVVRVEEGETTKVLPDLELAGRRTIAWLDYDKGLTSPVLQDTYTICSQVSSGSILLVTLNSNASSLRNQKDEHGATLSEEQVLKRFGRDLIPTPLPVEATQTTGYPLFLAGILFEHIQRVIRKTGRSESFIPLFNYNYKDNSPMITIGGMIANQQDAEALKRRLSELRFEYVTREEQFVIDVPNLTFKEKLTLDRILPRLSVPTAVEVEELGFPLRQRQIDSYHKFYRFYPTFAELTI